MTIGETFPHSEIDLPSSRRRRSRPDWRPAKPEDALRRRIEARQPLIRLAFAKLDRVFPRINGRYDDASLEALIEERELAHVCAVMNVKGGMRRLDRFDEALLKALADRLARHRR